MEQQKNEQGILDDILKDMDKDKDDWTEFLAKLRAEKEEEIRRDKENGK
jgi:hypothetical protein